jgi:L-ascorbate metabolism protein UlaG (beta-lactamase superfamily)
MKFKNLDGSVPESIGNVLKWAVVDRLRGARKPDTRPFETPRVENDGRKLRDNTGEPLVTWVGHATWLVQLGGKNLLIDPIWAKAISGVVKRNCEPGVRIEDLPRIDAVLVSHNHRDHMDAPTLKRFTSSLAIVPTGLGGDFRKLGYANVVELEWWQAHALGDTVVTFVPSQHWSRRGLSDSNDTLWGGFVVAGGDRRVYHSGDTAYFAGFREIGQRLGPIDVALLPIGAYDPEWFMRKQHMNPEDAVHAFRDLKARRMLAMHWGTYQLTDEWLGEPPEKLKALLSGAADAQKVEVVAIGQSLTV